MSPSAVTIGNFDGVHAGHRQIMRRVAELGRQHGWTPTVLTFDPHPARVVAPQRAPRLLSTLAERCELIRTQGIENILVLPFTAEIAALTPDQFVARILIAKLNARAVLVGDNFRFGNRAAGNTDTMRQLGEQCGFITEVVSAIRKRNRIVSSSEIRRLIDGGNVSLACRLLERPYAIVGEVVPGHGVGRKQTVPTLNLDSRAEVLPAVGVYITRTVDRRDGRTWQSITNVGFRPTFGGGDLTIETFLLSPLTGNAPETIGVQFLRRVRDERKFETPEALRTRILEDVVGAKTYFARLSKWKCRKPAPTYSP